MGRGAGEGFVGCGGGGEDGGGGGGEGGEGWGEDGWGEGEWVALVGGGEVGGPSWSMRGGLSDNDTICGVLGWRGYAQLCVVIYTAFQILMLWRTLGHEMICL